MPPKKKPAQKKPASTAKAVTKPSAKKSGPKAAPKPKRKTKAQIEKEKQAQGLKIIEHIENGLSVRQAVRLEKISSKTFYKWRQFLTPEEQKLKDKGQLEGGGENGKRYARACEDRKQLILEEVIEIADDQSGDMIKFYDQKKKKWVEYEDKEFTSRAKLRIETRLKYLEMVDPEKYGANRKTKVEGDITISFK